MAEPTLSVTLGEIRREVSRFLSFGREYDALTITQQEDVDSIIRRGLRQFYQPPAVNGKAHQWTFLRPTGSMTTVPEQEAYPLPDDFGAMMGSRVTYTERRYIDGPRIVSDYAYRQHVEESARRLGFPDYATIRVRPSTISSGPIRYDLLFFPVPDGEFQMEYQYQVVQDAVTANLDHVAGGAMHGETILASCLAIAEEYVVDPIAKYRELFRERLVTSVSLDRSSRGDGIIGRMRPTGDDGRRPLPRVSIVRYAGLGG